MVAQEDQGRRPGIALGDKVGAGLVAAALSLFGFGFGHAALGRPKRGAMWLVLVLACLVAMVKSIYLLPVAGVVFVAGVLDASVLAFRKREQPQFQWPMPWVLVLPAVSLASVMAVRMFTVESFKAGSTSMAPTLQIGDSIFIDKLSTPKRGDVIVFSYPCEPTRDYMFRLIADAGDTVEVRCGVVYVNGKALEQTLVEKPDACSYEDYDQAMGKWFKRTCVRYREGAHDIFGNIDMTTGVAANPRDYPLGTASQPMCFGANGDEPRSVEYKVVETKPGYEAKACEQQLHAVVPRDHVFVLGDNRFNANDSRIWGAVPKSSIKGRVIGIWSTNRPGEGRRFNRFGPIQ